MKADNRFFKLACIFIAGSAFIGGTSSCAKPAAVETVVETTVAATPTPTPSPTPTPTPSPTPLPTPVPTPVPEYVEPQFEETWYNGFVDARSVRAQIVDNPEDIAVLVNKYYALPLDYVPPDLVDAPHSMNQQIRAEACDAWLAMYDACV